jgi:hypothetical protein
VQVVEAEFADMLDPDVSAASAWRTHTTPAAIMRMRALESVEASIARPSIRETSADAVRAGMASKTVSVRLNADGSLLKHEVKHKKCSTAQFSCLRAASGCTT